MRKTTLKTIKNFVKDGIAKDISNVVYEEFINTHKQLKKICVSHGTYGINGGVLEDEQTGELFAITARNSMLFRFF